MSARACEPNTYEFEFGLFIIRTIILNSSMAHQQGKRAQIELLPNRF